MKACPRCGGYLCHEGDESVCLICGRRFVLDAALPIDFNQVVRVFVGPEIKKKGMPVVSPPVALHVVGDEQQAAGFR